MRVFIVSLVLLSLIAITVPAFAAVQTVNVSGFTFTPRSVTIAVGDSVMWVRHDGTHTATSGDTTTCTGNGTFNAPLDLGHQSFIFRFTSAGSFPYFCTFHCALSHMHGSVVVQGQSDVPSGPGIGDSRLLRAVPNPFQPGTVLNMTINHAGPVRLEMFDSSGRLVATLADRAFEPGQYSIPWDGRTTAGTEAPSGVYFARRMDTGSVVSAIVIRTR